MEQDGSNPIRINCVILNFNDGETVARLVHMIHDYDYLEKIVLVDNHSTDDSWEQLQVLKDEKVELIRTEKNGGYGYGNNTDRYCKRDAFFQAKCQCCHEEPAQPGSDRDV